MSAEATRMRREILHLVHAYAECAFPSRPFTPGESPVPVSGKVFDASEVQHLVDSALDFWLTSGRFARQFETQFAAFLGLRHALLTNSGSSANLLAVSALTSSRLGERRLNPGDEVITVAAAFPTTVNPILQNGLVPVFVDVSLPTYNIDPDALEAALSDKTRAVIVAHTLGNPFDAERVVRFCRAHGLWLIEDCCDALGSRHAGRMAGTWGDVATFSFYPAHHITMGEGGCLATDDAELKSVLQSMRDWGRDCTCEPGFDDTCGRRFKGQFGKLPRGYDHKYVYSHIGYNLKATDMQAAIGLPQLKKLPDFICTRKRNFALLHERLRVLQSVLVLPEATRNSDPAWFGFPITVGEDAPFTRDELTAHLERRRIATRLLFAGDLTKQPAYAGTQFRVCGPLHQTERIMNATFWVGVYPGLTDEMMNYVADEICSFVAAAERQGGDR